MADKTLRIGSRNLTIHETFIDRAINWLDPIRGARRLRSRATQAIAGQWYGGLNARRTMSAWKPPGGSADADILFDLPLLRQRSRDLERNNPIASGAIATCCNNILGSGLRLHSSIDRDILRLDDPAADAWEAKTQAEWRLYFESREADAARTLSGHELADMVLRQTLLNGDVFVNLPRFARPGSPYTLRLQLIEADRVANKQFARDTDELAGGIRRDTTTGAPIEYHVLKQHPGTLSPDKRLFEWDVLPAFGARTGLPAVIHCFRPTRPGQSRGVPYLAPIMEPIKQLGRYSEAELDAAVIASMFTVFIETESGGNFLDITNTAAETGATGSDNDLKLAPGAILGLAKGEKIEIADPKRPNTAFDPFVLSILRQIGIALELPFEVLVKHFQSSYSAARAALLDAWKFFSVRRAWLARNFYQSVYEVWMYEAVASGRISAPGYFTDPLIRMAYLSSDWIGPSPGQINPTDEVSAAENRLSLGLSTRSEETAALTGGDFERNIRQIKKELAMIKDAGLSSGGVAEDLSQTPNQPAVQKVSPTSDADENPDDEEFAREDQGEEDDERQ